jgi:4-alpha-glucanotransferase
VIRDKLARLGVRRLLLAIHDASFPSDPGEDLGRGSPATAAADRLFEYARALGFTGIQLGPQGQTSRGNPSPYDGMLFSRHLGNIALRSFSQGGAFAGLVDDSARAAATWTGDGPAQHARAYDAIHALVATAYSALDARPDLRARLAAFRTEHASWLESDASFHALAIDRYAFGQMLVHDEHARLRQRCQLALYGDLQIGFSEADAWHYAPVFLAGYAMGAPPSRTNPDGQPWGYPVLDPAQYTGAARALVVARADKAFREYDSLRIDHPHGLVCPWVYRGDDVQHGARLFESPGDPDLARFAIAREDQLDRGKPRYADDWVRELDDAQVERYAVLFDAIVDAAQRAGRAPADLSCEVLSTMPLPLQRVLARHGLGRWRVTQKARLDDPSDVYRAENAAREDWVMLGNHDTAPIFAVIRGWSPAQREAWARHLSARLHLPRPERLASAGFLATAMLAELFASRAENVSIFFADLFGYEERFNVPGVISADNWTLRLPPDFADVHARRLAQEAALDLPAAVELALNARLDP